jgi:hypothetical protein
MASSPQSEQATVKKYVDQAIGESEDEEVRYHLRHALQLMAE